jgi:Cd2+/Zn2+-exporting ATPase
MLGAAGTDKAADVVLMDDDLGKLAEFLALSRCISGILMQNIVLALGFKTVFLVLALTG